MSQTPPNSQIALNIALEATRKWRGESNLAAENRSLSSVITAALRLAVTDHADPPSGIAALHDLDCHEHLERMLACNTRLCDSLLAGGNPTGAVSHNITATHVALLLGNSELARELLQPSLDSRVLNHFPLTPFWRCYATALNGLVTQTSFATPDTKLKGYEKHWMPYISLMAAMVNGTDNADLIAAVDESFAKRNRDKRLTDWETIDGDGNSPVRWDFRKATITGTS